MSLGCASQAASLAFWEFYGGLVWFGSQQLSDLHSSGRGVDYVNQAGSESGDFYRTDLKGKQVSALRVRMACACQR